MAGVAGILFLSGDPRWLIGLPLQALSLWLILRAFPEKFPVLVEFEKSLATPKGKAKSSRKAKSLRGTSRSGESLADRLFFLFPLGLTALAMALLQEGLLYPGAGVLVAVLALLLWKNKNLCLGPAASSVFPETAAWVSLLALAALARLPWVGYNFAGLQIDEANNLMSCVSVLEGVLKSPFATAWWGNPSFTYFLTAGVLKVFGLKLAVARCVSAVDALLAIFAFYKICRLYFSVSVSWIAGLLFSASWWNLYFSFSPFHNMFTVLFELGTLYFLLRGLRDGKSVFYLASGLFMGASLMSYLPGRLVPAMVFLVLGILAFWRGNSFVQVYWRPVVLGALAFLWMVGPFLVYCFHNPGDFMGRTQELSVLKVMENNHDWFFPMKSAFFTFFTFLWPNGDLDPRFGIPGISIMDAFAGGLMVLGLFLSFFAGPARLRAVLWVGLAVAMSTNALAVQGGQPLKDYFNPMRCFLTIPFLFLAVAFALEWLSQRAAKLPKAFRAGLGVLLATGVVFSVGVNANIFFHKFTADRGIWASLGFNHLLAADTIEQNAPKGHIVVHWTYESSVVQFLTYQRIPVTSIDHPELPLNFQVQKDVILIFEVGEWGDAIPGLHKFYPGAQWTVVTTPWKENFLWVVRIPKDEIEKARGKAKLGPALP
jgi:hypothetical protein